MDLRSNAEQQGQTTDSGEVKIGFNNFLTRQKSEQELDRQHDALAETALDKCFHAMC